MVQEATTSEAAHETWGFSDLNYRLCNSHSRLCLVSASYSACMSNFAMSPGWYPRVKFISSMYVFLLDGS
jgi:hypothetical protein